jgi:hypothetical protein
VRVGLLVCFSLFTCLCFTFLILLLLLFLLNGLLLFLFLLFWLGRIAVCIAVR